MCKRMKMQQHDFKKMITFAMAWWMMAGCVCIPVCAKEETEAVSGQEAGGRQNGEDKTEDMVTDSGKEAGEEESKKIRDEAAAGHETEEEAGGEEVGAETVSGNDTKAEEEKDRGEGTVSDNDIAEEEPEDMVENDGTIEIVNVVVPTVYTLALNPYRLPVRTGEEETTTEQVISGTYGIVNKSSTDQIVTVSLTVEDNNEGGLVFVDSAEEAENAGMNIYAVYLAVVPANEEQILIGDEPIDENVSGDCLQNVRMTGVPEQAVTLHEGMNQVAFKLSGAVYSQDKETIRELAPDGLGATAYTFSGVMNPDAEWEKLSGGVKLSVAYTYETADGSEKTVEGTGAMTSI